MYNVNLWSIVVASIVSFAIGAIWYSPILFGREWLALTKNKEPDVEDSEKKSILGKYVIHFIGTVISFCVFGFIISFSNSYNSLDGAFFGFLIWLGFIATTMMGDYLWNKSPFKLFMINSIGSLISLIVGGAIIGAW